MGPPGTGKTDVAVQIISNIYHNFPEQRTLIVTHSNQVYMMSTQKWKSVRSREPIVPRNFSYQNLCRKFSTEISAKITVHNLMSHISGTS